MIAVYSKSGEARFRRKLHETVNARINLGSCYCAFIFHFSKHLGVWVQERGDGCAYQMLLVLVFAKFCLTYISCGGTTVSLLITELYDGRPRHSIGAKATYRC